MQQIAIVGTGFVADLYMGSLQKYKDIQVLFAYDINEANLTRFCDYWKVRAASDIQTLMSAELDLVLNLTNPRSHFDVSKLLLESGHHVYSEKPLAMEMDQAYQLQRIAAEKALILASAPCSFLGETAQILRRALDQGLAGKPYLVYAELDDDFVPQAAYEKWLSVSGAPWPYRDEVEVGCTLEHAGYYLTWLMQSFGSVKKVIAASADLVDNKIPGSNETAPDYSTAMLFFESGVVARLTCSIIAPHDHRMQVFCENGILSVDECWDNSEKVKFKKRFRLRRRLITSPLAKTLKLKGPTHKKVEGLGSAAMNFALGPVEILESLQEKRECRLTAEFALHLTEVTLAIQNSRDSAGVQVMQTKMPQVTPMPWAT